MKATGKSYRQIVTQQFKKNKPAVIGLYMILFLVFTAIFADFFANDKPLTCVINGEKFYPVFKEYAVDLGISNWNVDQINIDWKELEYDSAVWPLVPYLPTNLDYTARFQSPGSKHILGTDQIGRDVLSGMIHGTRIALSVGLISMGIAVLIGVFVGAIAGYYGGAIDIIVQRLI